MTLLLAAVVLAGVAHAAAQRLGGDGAPAAPDLAGRSYLEQVTLEIDGEIAALAEAERGADEPRRIALRALISYRLVALELLSQGRSAGPAGSVAALTGLRLVYGREAIDRGVLQLPTGAPRALGADELGLLQRFCDASVDRLASIRTHDPVLLDRHLPGIMRILWTFFEAEPPAPSCWPAGVEAPTPTADPAARLADLRVRTEIAPLSDAARDALLEMLDVLERGMTFPEYRDSALEIVDETGRAFDVVAVIATTELLGEDGRAALIGRIEDALRELAAPATRTAGRRGLQRCATFAHALVGVNELAAEGVNTAQLATGLDELARAGPWSRGQVEAVADIVARMLAYRRLARSEPVGPLRSVERRLRRSYLDAEEAVVDGLITLAATPAAATDPALASLLDDHAQRLADVERIQGIEGWGDSIARVVPRQRDAFEAQMKRWCTALLDPQRRVQALDALEAFERQHARFVPLPFEARLRSGDRVAVTVTGGQPDRLLAAIDEERLRWARAWCRGEEGGAAGRRLDLIARLGQSMDDAVDLVTVGPDVVLLNRWGAWTMPEALLRRLAADPPARLKLATAAILAGDDEEATRQVEFNDADAKLGRLVGRLASALRPRLRALGPPGDPADPNVPPDPRLTLAPTVVSPPPGAWWIDQREALAVICRYAIELDYAAAEERAEDVAALRAFVDANLAALAPVPEAPAP